MAENSIKARQLILSTKEIPFDENLTYEELEQHANKMLRYQNVSDIIRQGPDAIQPFIERAQSLFNIKLQEEFSYNSNQIPDLNLTYKTVFFRTEDECESQAIPMVDWIGFRFKDACIWKYGFGILFSFYGREYDREKLEAQCPNIGEIDVARALYSSMYQDNYPDLGVLNQSPIMTMVGLKDPTTKVKDKMDQYYGQLGLQRTIIHPSTSPGNFRCFHHDAFHQIDPIVKAAAFSIGQSMQEIIRPHIYRNEADPGTHRLPHFDWEYQKKVRQPQSELAKKWVNDHMDAVLGMVAKQKEKEQRMAS